MCAAFVACAALLPVVSFAQANNGAPKVLRVAMKSAERAFDPQVESDQYSNWISHVVFDSLYKYDYLARPVKVVPNTAEAEPEITDNGTTYTIRIKPGIYYSPDPAFKNQRRELTADDYIYSIKRLMDPSLRAQWQWLVDGKIVGLDELAETAKKTGKFNYDAKIEGLQALSKHTLRVKLKRVDYNFLYILAMTATSAMAREVVEAYKGDIGAHPVGTGPFVLKQHTRRSKIVLEKSPTFRDVYFNTKYADPNDPQDKEAVKYLAGRKLPIVDRVEINVIEEPQPRFLAFLNKEHDVLVDPPADFIRQMLTVSGDVVPNLKKEGVKAQREPQMEITYTYFNMEDPVVGGYTPEKVALRRAIVLAYDNQKEITVARKGQAEQLQSPIPPGLIGYDPELRTQAGEHNLAKAKALLDMYGYVDRDGDGYREDPQGRPLRMVYSSQPTQDYVDLEHLWYQANEAVGLKVEIRKQQFADLIQAAKLKQLQIWGLAWHADFPDAENFLQLLYGPNCGQANNSCFSHKHYDELYEKAASMPPSPERDAVYKEMVKLFVAYAPWKLGVYRIYNHMSRPWAIGFKHHPIDTSNFFVYTDIDPDAQRKGTQ
jgi:oligopeptide transport system substrate-binding protein